MQPNRTKALLAAGQAAIGPTIMESWSVAVVRIMAAAGFDYLFLDTEHTSIGSESLYTLIQMSLASDITPLVRVVDLSYPLVSRALDMGAQGIIIPRVETREQAEAAVSYVKYPPLGRRGAGGDARYGYARRPMQQAIAEANAETMVVVMVESGRGLENLDEIASVPGLDVIHIGPQDLSISLGIPWQMDHPRLQEAITHVVDTCRRHGVTAGQNDRDAASFRQWYEMGFRFLCCNNDLNMLTTAAQQDARMLREIVAAG